MRTTIAVESATRDRLKSIGQKGESYDHLLNRLLDEWETADERITELEIRLKRIVVFEPVRPLNAAEPHHPDEPDVHGSR